MTASWWQRLAGGWRGRSNGHAASDALRQFRSEVTAAVTDPLDRALLESLLARPGAAGLTDDDVELEVEALRGAVDLIDLQEQVARDGLPIVPHQHKSLGGERCHFIASVSLADDTSQRSGRLFFTETRLAFVSTPLVTLPWGAIAAIREDGRDLIVVAPGRGALHRFRCNSYTDARCGRFLADRLRESKGRP
jgi:hypothetical protein